MPFKVMDQQLMPSSISKASQVDKMPHGTLIEADWMSGRHKSGCINFHRSEFLLKIGWRQREPFNGVDTTAIAAKTAPVTTVTLPIAATIATATAESTATTVTLPTAPTTTVPLSLTTGTLSAGAATAEMMTIALPQTGATRVVLPEAATMTTTLWAPRTITPAAITSATTAETQHQQWQ